MHVMGKFLFEWLKIRNGIGLTNFLFPLRENHEYS